MLHRYLLDGFFHSSKHPSFFQLIIIEQLLYAKHCSSCYKAMLKKTQNPYCHGAYIPAREDRQEERKKERGNKSGGRKCRQRIKVGSRDTECMGVYFMLDGQRGPL